MPMRARSRQHSSGYSKIEASDRRPKKGCNSNLQHHIPYVDGFEESRNFVRGTELAMHSDCGPSRPAFLSEAEGRTKGKRREAELSHCHAPTGKRWPPRA